MFKLTIIEVFEPTTARVSAATMVEALQPTTVAVFKATTVGSLEVTTEAGFKVTTLEAPQPTTIRDSEAITVEHQLFYLACPIPTSPPQSKVNSCSEQGTVLGSHTALKRLRATRLLFCDAVS